MLRSLSPEQQRALAEQYGLSGIQGDGGQTDRPLDQPVTSRPKIDQGANDRWSDSAWSDTAMFQTGSPRIRGGDTILLDLQLGTLSADGASSATEKPYPDKSSQKNGYPDKSFSGTLPANQTYALPDLQPQDLQALEQLRQRALAANPYRLDKLGRLQIPGLSQPIALAGLTADQASERLRREPALQYLTTTVSLLSLERIGVDALKPFGYDLFSNVPTTYAPATDIPVPPEYTVGPGDAVKVQLIGNVKANYTLVVGRNGEIRFPELGPISVAGMPFNELQSLIEKTVADQMIGTRAVVGLGELRSLRVLITGEAERPGSYTVSGLSTMTNALLVSGGVKPIGSLRNVQLKRGGRLVATLDLYDLLLKGDASKDARLLSGDVIFIPPVGNTAGITGEIRRPAIYEYKGAATVQDLIELSGGLTAEAAPRLAKLDRVDASQGHVLLDVDLGGPQGRAMKLKSGDTLRVAAVRETVADAVRVSGHVYRAGPAQFRPGMRLADLLPGVDELKPNADLHYVLIRRELPPDRRVTVLSADIAKAWAAPQSEANVVLAPRDQVIVFDLEATRSALLDPVIADLNRQSSREHPSQIVNIGGNVRMPGDYPLEAGMRVADLVRAGGGMNEAAFAADAELVRYEVINGESRRTELLPINLAAAQAGDSASNIVLQPFDVLTIRSVPQWSDQEAVTLQGEVRFPGRYPIRRGETLTSVISRAGGLTDLAFAEGVVFTRENLKEREAQQIAALTSRLERDMAAMAVQRSQVDQQSGGAQSLSVGQSLLAELRNTKPVGRLAIDLPQVLAAKPGSAADILLKDGDRLVVPRRSQEVTVLGEVQTATSHLYQPGLSRSDYVGMSGGTTQKADAGRIYVVKANGQVVASSKSRWFGDPGKDIRPGDTIVVPVDTERLPPLPMWSAVTTIIYNLAVAVAAVNSF
ncbi:MAG: SLBB domain-containing protein [Chromatiales bacterium]|nr:SLBB domain-containing protein [Chromatiales bacterium]